ncbi:ABC transporter substrate-binding protein [Phytoactinopolyspora halotolerans]|uniref:ABC transporter substrate-binding protein n=1 Tax=Phytoactinopolyspora halotolerans TaxID=1981512 RepID=A0A6L9S944_9ACTN|nr:ABC transporter substrate-binding protein [Phytoactinopolyspora halotolerans]NEE01935.1 ABC transporter substrate-binding protein [Phytoactinopolyspora halotolerans]
MPGRSRTAIPVAAATVFTLALAACGQDADNEAEVAGSDAPDASDGGTGAVEAEDWTGKTVTLEQPAERVVCLDGTCIDALAELGVEPVASLQIDQVQHPYFFGPDAATQALDGTFFEPSIEGIVAAEPDLVVGSAAVHGELQDALGDIPFFGVELSDDGDAEDNLQRLAVLTDRQDEAETAVERYRSTLADYQPGARATSVLSMYGGATNDIGIDALDSGIGRLLARYTDYPWPAAQEGESGFLEIGLEDIVAVDPEHIFVLDFAFDPDAPALVEQLEDEPIWGTLQAVRNGTVHVVDNAWWGTTSGTRGEQLYLDVVMPTVYPDEFPEPLGIAAP